MEPLLNRCINCGAELQSEDATCDRCDQNLSGFDPRKPNARSDRGGLARAFITLFVCIFAPLCAYGLYDSYHAKVGMQAAFLTYLSFPIGIFIPALFLFFYGYATYLTFIAIGAGGLCYGLTTLTMHSVSPLVVVVIGYAILSTLYKREPKHFPANIPRGTLIAAGSAMGWALQYYDKPVTLVIGGTIILYVALGALLARYRPDLGKRLGITILEDTNVPQSREALIEKVSSDADYREKMAALRALGQFDGICAARMDAMFQRVQAEANQEVVKMMNRIAEEQGLSDEVRMELDETVRAMRAKLDLGEKSTAHKHD